MTDELIAKLQQGGLKVEKWDGTPSASVFLSNAALALESIKQEKASPVQWLTKLQKAGGIHPGEDKWLGLSDWLKSNPAATLQKEDIRNYIKENEIHVKDVLYLDEFSNQQMLKDLQAEFDELVAEGEEETGSLYTSDYYDYAFRQMTERYGRDFYDGFEKDSKGQLMVYDAEPASRVLGVKPANKTRLEYTTDDLENKRELALYVPEIDPWKKEDTIHFGDAGEGRCIGWIRFGEVKEVYNYTPEERQAMLAAMPGADKWKKVTYDRQYVPEVWYPPVQQSRYPNAHISMMRDKYCVWNVRDMLNTYYPTFEEAVNAYNRHIVPKGEVTRSLVIDEIQSNRHQEGKKNGYFERGVIAEYDRLLNISSKNVDAYYERLREIRKEKNWEGAVDEQTEKLWRDNDPELDFRYDKMKLSHAKATMFKREHVELETVGKEKGRVPDAPFQDNWYKLCMKRMVRYAAENGYDRIAWTTGEQQAERYNLGAVITSYSVEPYQAQSKNEIDGFDVDLYTNLGKVVLFVDKQGVICSGEMPNNVSLADKPLEKVVGKEVAERILSATEYIEYRYMDNNVRFGIDGMKLFYDEKLPAFMNKFGKKWGVKTEKVEIGELEPRDSEKHSITITDEMKRSVMQGQPMFMYGKDGQMLGFIKQGTVYLTDKGMKPETLVHEYTHAWAMAMQHGNPEGWQSIKDLLYETPAWQAVVDDPEYRNITHDDDLVTSEVLAHISGKTNADKLNRIMARAQEGDNKTDSATLMNDMLERLRQALHTFWAWVGRHMFDIQHFRSVDEVTDRVLYDLLHGNHLEIGKVLHCAPPLGTTRISHVRVFEGLHGKLYIRCKVDGQQQMGVPIKPHDQEAANDKTQLHDLATRYFAAALDNQSQNIEKGRKL